MKKTAYIVSLVALLFTTIATMAQTADQYALYNYRNDGDFNAWLNIDVDSITYSCRDLNGVEHDDVVTQEVWTPDSVYRIPLDVVDSIAFRAPEPVFRDGVFHITEDHLPYTVGVEPAAVTFSSSMPAAMLPAVGQVVVSDIYDTPFDEGFAGRVVKIETTGGGSRVECEEVTLDDIFDEFVYVGKSIAYNDESRSVSAHRSLRERNMDGTVEFPLGKFKLDLVSEKEIDEWSGETIDKDSYVTISGSPTIIIDYTIRHVKNQDDIFKVVLSNKSKYELELKLSADGKAVDKEVYCKSFIPIPMGVPAIYGKICFGGFFTIEGDATLAATIPLTLQQNIGFDSTADLFDGIIFNFEGSKVETPELTASLNGSVSGGLAFKYVTCVVAEKLVSANIKLKTGPKLSGKIELSSNGFVDGGWSWYEAMKDTKVTFEPFVAKVSGGLELFKKKKDWSYTLPLGDYIDALKKREYFIFPEFTAPELPSYFAFANGDYAATAMTTEVTRNLLLPVVPGLAVYDKDDNPIELVYSDSTYRWEADWTNSNLQMDMSGLKAGEDYVVRPIFKSKYFGSVKARPTSDFTMPSSVSFSQPEVKLAEGQETVVTLNGGWGMYEIVGDDQSVVSYTFSGDGFSGGGGAGGGGTAWPDDEFGGGGGGGGTAWGDHVPMIILVGKQKGHAVITVKDIRTGETATLDVTVADIEVAAETIDLGLPSGTLWASYNIGASRPEEYGDYLSWGETEPQPVEYYWTTYSHCDGVSNSNHDIGQDISGTEYDAAHVRWGDGWTMPTKADFKELTSCCDYKMTTRNGVKGFEFTGPNGNTMFIPAAGYRFRTNLQKEGEEASCWSATQTTNVNFAHEMNVSADQALWDCYINRFAGLTVRPVKHLPPVPADAVDLGLPSGTLWASYNIGATEPEGYGSYFSWGETEPKDWYSWGTYTHCDGTKETCHDIGIEISGTEYDVARVKWGEPWQMPTSEQINELVKNCQHEWTTHNGVNGTLVTGPNGNTIFLPAAGFMSGSTLYHPEEYGLYKSGTRCGEDDLAESWLLNADEKAFVRIGIWNSTGHTVRPVISGSSR